MVVKSKGIPYKIVTKTVEICLGFIPTQVVAGNHHQLMSQHLHWHTKKKPGERAMRNCSKCMEVCEGSSCLGFHQPRQRCVINRRWVFFTFLLFPWYKRLFQKGHFFVSAKLGGGIAWVCVRYRYRGVARNFFGRNGKLRLVAVRETGIRCQILVQQVLNVSQQKCVWVSVYLAGVLSFKKNLTGNWMMVCFPTFWVCFFKGYHISDCKPRRVEAKGLPIRLESMWMYRWNHQED